MLGGNNYFNPKYLFRNDEAVKAQQLSFYYADAISREAVQIVSAHVTSSAQTEMVIKLGELGCAVVDHNRLAEYPLAEVVQPIDIIAAGDSFNAAYLHACLTG